MSMKRNSLIAAALSASLSLFACSSSNNNDTTTTQPQAGLGQGTENPDGLVDDPDTGITPDNNSTDGENNVPDDSSPTTALDLRTVGDDILISIAGYELETLSEEIGLIADVVSSSATSITNLPDTSVEISEQSTPQTYPVSNVQYDCAQGGSLTTNTLAVDVSIAEDRFSNKTDSVTYRFDQCLPSADTSETLNGTMTVARRVVSQFRSSVTENTFIWQSFQWQQADGTAISITASISELNQFNGRSNEIRSVSIADNTRSVAGVVSSGVQDARFSLSNTGGAGSSFDFFLDAAGDIIDPSGTRITMLANPPLTRSTTGPGVDGEIVPFTGQIDFTADDGSSLAMVAKPASAVGTKLLDISYTDINGITSTMTDQPLVKLDVFQR